MSKNKFSARLMYDERLKQIKDDLKKQYRKGAKKDKKIITALLDEQNKINSIINKNNS